MKTFKFNVSLKAEVDAFSESDAWDAIQELFGVGKDCGVVVTECEYSEL